MKRYKNVFCKECREDVIEFEWYRIKIPILFQNLFKISIGIDLGLKNFVVIGITKKNINKKVKVKKIEKKLKREQRKLSRKYESLKKRNKILKGEATRQNIQKQVIMVLGMF